jgi:hypothetical protein
VPSEFDFAELIEVFSTSDCMIGIIHSHISRRFTLVAGNFEVGTIPSLKDVNLRIVDIGINHVVHGAILGSEMFRTDARV